MATGFVEPIHAAEQVGANLTDTAGKLSLTNATTQTTAPAAGAGAALPATPAVYLKVNINGVDRFIAAY